MTYRTVEITLNDVDIEVSGDYEPYVPAKLFALPEDCHPEEGGSFYLDCILYIHKDFKLDLSEILEHRHDEINELCYDALQGD